MKITLVNHRTMTRNIPPLGMLYVAAVLEQEGIEVKVIDPPPLIAQDYNYVNEILKTNPDIVGFTLLSNQVGKVIPIIKTLKKIRPDITIIAGGPHPSFVYENTLKSGVDVVVIGEGEITTKELVKAIEKGKDIKTIKGIAFKNKGKIIKTMPREFIKNLDELPLPARHLVDMDFYSKRSVNIRGLYLKATMVMTSRGCPGQCVFCASPNMWKRTVRFRSPKKVVDEMEFLYNKYNLDGFFVLDDTFVLNNKHVSGVCDEIKQRGLDIQWCCQGRVNTTTEEMLKDITNAGCVQIEYGCESGSQRILNLIKKDITVEQIENAFRKSKKFNIRRFASFVLGFPTETKKDIELTRNLAKRIKADHYEFFVLTPYPGTEIFDIAVKQGYKPEYEKRIWSHDHRGKAQAYWESNFTKEEILKIRDNLQKEFRSKFVWNYATNPYVIKDLTKSMLRKNFYTNLTKIRSSEDFVYFVVDQITS